MHPAPQVETQRRLWEEKEAKAKMEAAAKEELERKRVERQVTPPQDPFRCCRAQPADADWHVCASPIISLLRRNS